MNTNNRLPRIILVIVLAASSLAFLVQPVKAATCAKYHTVQRGETLYGIGLKYGISWTKLAEINILVNPRLIFAGQKLCISLDSGATPTPKPPPGGQPTFKIVSVVKDKSVTIETANLPANDSFDVLMGPFGTKGISGKKVEVLSSGKGGVITANFKIPAILHGSSTIAIRLQSPTSGSYSYNWFYNRTTGTGTTQPPSGGYTGFPTFTIASVVKDKTVTIKTNNFPPNDSFDVLMGAMGTRGVNGIKVATTSSGKGGIFTVTYDVPTALKGSYQIAIRLQSPTSGYYSYNWFYNNTAP